MGTSTTLYAGDLLEQGAHPPFEDSCPEDWADALPHLYEALIPGHGKPNSDQLVKTIMTP